MSRSKDRRARRQIARAIQYIVIDHPGFGHVGFDREDREAHFFHQKLQDAVLRLKEFPRAMRGFAKTHDARVSDHGFLEPPCSLNP